MKWITYISHKLNRAVVLLIPPVFFWAYRKLIGKKPKVASAFFEGVYQSFDDLTAQSGVSPRYYWPGFFERDLEDQKLRMATWISAPPFQGNYRTNFLSSVLALSPGEKVRVLDIGGGLNNVYEYLKFSLNKQVHVTVVDQLPTVENGIRLYGDDPSIQFVAKFPETKNAFDVVYLGSSIQYFPDFRKLMRDIARLGPELIVIADSSFGISQTFACKQVNMPGVVIPYLVINKEEFEAVAREYGYECVCRSMNRDAGQHFDTYEYPYNLTRSWNFVLKKIDDLAPELGSFDPNGPKVENI